MKIINRIRFTDSRSTHVRWYGISKVLTNRGESFSVVFPRDPTEHNDSWRSTKDTVEVSNRLLALPGVTHLLFRPYELAVTLSVVFDWTDLHEDIIEILKDGYFKGVEEVVIQQSQMSRD